VGAVILAAGQGLRLRPVTDNIPKPLVPILNVSLLQWSLRALAATGVTGAVVNVFHKADQIRDAVDDMAAATGVGVRVVVEDRLSGPAGGLLACRPFVAEGSTDCLVLHGDVFSDIALTDVLRTHRESGAEFTVATTPVNDPHRFGVLEAEGSRVVGFREKPPDAPPGSLISCGIYAISPALLRSLDSNSHTEFDFHHVISSLLERGAVVTAHRTGGYWSDIGDVGILLGSNLAALEHDAVLSSVAMELDDSRIWSQGSADIDASVKVEGRVLVGRGSRIGPGATIESSVIGPGCQVGAGAVVRHSVLLAGTAIDESGVVVDKVLV
jgi:NDP-sugar pyrophosphorylase family protein